jgi:hypothetical protein
MKHSLVNNLYIEAFTSRFAAESDRAAAVLGAALLDERLKKVFYTKLVAKHESLLGKMSPLGTFSSRINLAFALRWIDQDTECDLNIIRDVRNDFAHHLDHNLSFETQSIADRCKNLCSAAAFIDGFSEASKHNPIFSSAIFAGIQAKFSSARWRFHLAVESINQVLAAIAICESLSYEGPSLVNECFQASAGTRFKIEATGTVSAAKQDD